VKTYKARDLLRQMAEAAHQCGDPGLQFDTTINDWHTSKVSGRINASNPCSEYLFLDDSACNLASLNLLKFLTPDGRFDVAGFRHAVDTLILAQEILVDRASYPTGKIAQNSHDFRPLGLGYANLGAVFDGAWVTVRQRCGQSFCCHCHGHTWRAGVSDECSHCTGDRMLRWFSAEPRVVSSGGQ
jgi:ribonucleoside-diphosphate reductase alpha chain